MNKRKKARLQKYIAAKALAASLLLAATPAALSGKQIINDIDPIDATKDIAITGQQSGTAEVPDAAPDLVKKLYPLMGGGALAIAPLDLNPALGAVTVTDNLASGFIALDEVFTLLSFVPPPGVTLEGHLSAGMGGGLASMGDIDLWTPKSVLFDGNRAVAVETGSVTAQVDLGVATGGTVAGTLTVQSSVSLAGGGALASIMGDVLLYGRGDDSGIELSNNSASATGGLAAALGGAALAGAGDVDIDVDQNVSVTGNQASAQTGAPLVASMEKLEGAGLTVEKVALEGSLAAAGGGALASVMDDVYLYSNHAGVTVSHNQASATGGVAAALGGAVLAGDYVGVYASQDISVTGNQVSASSGGNVALTLEGLDLSGALAPTFSELKLRKGTLRLPLAAAGGGAAASFGSMYITAGQEMDLRGNSARASGGVAAALGGGLAGFGGVSLKGEGLSVANNLAQAAAESFELLSLQDLSMVYDDDGDSTTPNYRQSLESLSLQGSLAAALGGGVLGVGTEMDGGSENLVLSDNSVSASGGIAAALGGGFADLGGVTLKGKSAALTNNSAMAAATGQVSLVAKGLDLDLGFVNPDTKAWLASAELKLPIALAAGGAGASFSAIDVTADGTLDLRGNSATASGGVAAALGGGLAGFGDHIDLTAPEGVSIRDNLAAARGAQGAELHIDDFGLNLPGMLPLPLWLGKLEGHAAIAAAAGGAMLGGGNLATEKADVADNAALAQSGIALSIGGAGFMTVADPGTGNPLTAEFTNNRAEALGSQRISLSVTGLKLGGMPLLGEGTTKIEGSIAAALGGAGFIDVDALPSGGEIFFKDNRAFADGSIAAALGGAAMNFETDQTNSPHKIVFTRNRALARNTTGITLAVQGDALKELVVNLVGGIDPTNAEGLKALAGAGLKARSIAFAAGGAAFMPDEIYAQGEINFTGNEAIAEGDLGVALGGAVAGLNSVSIESGGNVTFAGNRVSGTTLGLGGAVYAYQNLELSAPNGRISFMTQGDDAVFGASMRIQGERLLGVRGAELVDQKTALAEAGIPHDVAKIFAPHGGEADLSQVETFIGEKGEPGQLFRVAAGGEVKLTNPHKAMVLGAAGNGRFYFMTVESDGIVGGAAADFSASGYRSASVGFDEENEGKGRHYYLDVEDTRDLLWSGKGSDLWYAGNSAEKNWLDGATEEHFYNADRVAFDDTAEKTIVNVLDAVVLPGGVTVAGSKDYAFVSTMGAPHMIGTPWLSLTGAGKTAFANLDVAVTDRFTAGAASQLVADGTRTNTGMAVVLGTGSAKLSVEDGAALMVQKAALNRPYQIVDGFGDQGDVMNWNALPYAGVIFDGAAWTAETAWQPITDGYVTLWNKGAVTFSDQFRVEADPTALLSLASTSLRLSRSFAEALNLRTYGQGNSIPAATCDLGRMNFLPTAHRSDKGVWGSLWYSRSSLDGMAVTGASGVYLQDTDTKSYGVTLGADFTRRGFTTGLGLQLGKYDSDGLNNSSADGKFMGLGLYGGFNRGSWSFTGDLGYNWFKSDMEVNLPSDVYKGKDIKSTVATAGVQANWHLPSSGKLSVTPFIGLRYSHYDQDSYKMSAAHMIQDIHSDSASVNQWTLPLGARFEWGRIETKKGWSFNPSVEVAYVRAFGDTDIKSRLRFLGSGASLPAMDFLSAVTNENSFRTRLQLEGKGNNMTFGIGLSGQFSSDQTDWGVGATFRWSF